MHRILLFLIVLYIPLKSFSKGSVVQDTTKKQELQFKDTIQNSIQYKVSPSNYLVRMDSKTAHKIDSLRKDLSAKFPNTNFNFAVIKATIPKQVNTNNIILRNTPEQWTAITLLIIVVLYSLLRTVFNKSLPVVFQAYWNDRAITQFTRDDNFFNMRNSIFYFGLFCLIYAFIAYQISQFYKIDLGYPDRKAYIFICGIIAIYYVAKYLILKFTGHIFNIQRLVSGYLAILSVSNMVFAILMIPFIVFIDYTPFGYKAYLVYFVLLSFVFNTFYKYLRTGSFILNNFQFPKFYLFIYLCTLEIMPLLVLYKLVIAQK
jgi:Domain of unknown function (DUF4271)